MLSCIICFYFVFNALTVVYIPRVFWLRLKFSYHLLVFLCEPITILHLNQYMHFLLLTMLLFIKLFWCKEDVETPSISMHLPATWQFRPFEMSWIRVSWGADKLSYPPPPPPPPPRKSQRVEDVFGQAASTPLRTNSGF